MRLVNLQKRGNNKTKIRKFQLGVLSILLIAGLLVFAPSTLAAKEKVDCSITIIKGVHTGENKAQATGCEDVYGYVTPNGNFTLYGLETLAVKDGDIVEISTPAKNYILTVHTKNGPDPIKKWAYENGHWAYYVDGVKQIGWIHDGTAWYYLDGNGVMKTGWFKDFTGTWYYLTNSGAMKTGWVHDGHAWYYLANSGAMKTGWVHDGYAWYYLTNSGAMKTGWVHDGHAWYYLTNSGAMATGWIQDGNHRYYLNGSGAMVTGWQNINGEMYYFYSNGQLA
ncbi:hypothetical protein V6C20_06670 [Caldibacillus thermoamylovorans]